MLRRKNRGFTLIELLVVIAILGILMAGVVIAINPAEKMAQARDASRKSSVGQLGTALTAYYTSQNAKYPTFAGWGTALTNVLVRSGELKSFPPQVGSTLAANNCGVNLINGYCYQGDATTAEVLVFSLMESKSETAHCTGINKAYWAYSTALGKACGWCGATDPNVANIDTAAECVY